MACNDSLEDPAHYVLECAGLADLQSRYPAVVAAAARGCVGGVEGKPPCRRCSSKHFANLANIKLVECSTLEQTTRQFSWAAAG